MDEPPKPPAPETPFSDFGDSNRLVTNPVDTVEQASIPSRPAQPDQPTEHVTIPLVGLEGFGERRAAQAERARQALGEEPGVRWAHVSAETEMAYVRYDPALATVDALLAAVTRCGLRGGEPSHR